MSIRAESSRGGWWQQWRRRSPLPVEKRYKIIRRLCVAFSSSSYLFVYDAGVPSSIFLYEMVVICFSPHGLSSPITPASLCHALLLSLYFIKALTHSLSLLLFTTTLTHTHTHTHTRYSTSVVRMCVSDVCVQSKRLETECVARQSVSFDDSKRSKESLSFFRCHRQRRCPDNRFFDTSRLHFHFISGRGTVKTLINEIHSCGEEEKRTSCFIACILPASH